MKVKLELTTLTASSQTPLETQETILVEATGVIITPYDSIPMSGEAINWILEMIYSATDQSELPQFEHEAEAFGEGAETFSFTEWRIDMDIVKKEAKNISIHRS
ncbi:MAG TPA: hypothetical protein P5539_13780 [Mesotoga sp.]|nr:hypothetical protein [Mesotoga sp.]